MENARSPASSFTVSGPSLLGLLGFAASQGAKVAGILEAHGLDARGLASPEVRVVQAVNDAVWSEVERRVESPDLGLAYARAFSLEHLPVLGHLAAHSATVRQALDRLVRHARILHDAGRLEWAQQDDAVRIYPGCRGLPHAPPRAIAEFSAALVPALLRRLTGRAWPVLEVTFRHARPASVQGHLRAFETTPRFDAAEAWVAVPSEVLVAPIAGADLGLARYLEAYAQALSSVLAPGTAPTSTAARVLDEVLRALPEGEVEANRIARRLGLHARTLQRRLSTEGTTYAAEVERARRTLAERHLAERGLSVAEVAFLLGYSEPSVFHRAFRRWTGQTPAEFRRAQSQ
jgi:AraC-like DNA-binding protein